jgi:hypothetical protein
MISAISIVWLIVILVGLFVVLILGIMLSVWCCEGQLSAEKIGGGQLTFIFKQRRFQKPFVLSMLSLCVLWWTGYGVTIFLLLILTRLITTSPPPPWIACLECIGCGLGAEALKL